MHPVQVQFLPRQNLALNVEPFFQVQVEVEECLGRVEVHPLALNVE